MVVNTPGKRQCVVCKKFGTRAQVRVKIDSDSDDYVHPACLKRQCVACKKFGTYNQVSVKIDSDSDDYVHPQCLKRQCVACEEFGTYAQVRVKIDSDSDDYVHPECLKRQCVACKKFGTYNQVSRNHPDGKGYCHSTLSCYGLHRFDDSRGCGLCEDPVFENQKTPAEVLKIVKERKTLDGFNLGIERNLIVMPDRPVHADCMDDEILEKAEELQSEINAAGILALPEDEQREREQMCLEVFKKLSFAVSPPANLNISFESDYYCSESECY
jgi:hypothetical protein